MHVVTSGIPFIDIDAYASMVALAELLRLQGEDAVAASSATLNSSIPTSLRGLDVQFKSNYKPSPDDIFTFVDLSDLKHFDFNANPDKVVTVVDHHLGFQDYWKEKLGAKARIEFIGAACTQVYELWAEAGLLHQMNQDSAKLLASGILDNTLNLKADITTERDQAAYAGLAEHAGLASDWPEQYFSECQAHTLADIEHAIINDAKTVDYPRRGKTRVGQIALWDVGEFIKSNRELIGRVLSGEGLPWFMNFIDVQSGRSVFLCEDPDIKTWLENLLAVEFENDLATAGRMWLRKEIFKQAAAQQPTEAE